MKLNLGCGEYIKEEYINIDIRRLPGVDVVADVLKLPFRDNSADEIRAIDVYEHVSYLKSQELLRHWVSILKKGGLLFIQSPSIDRVAEYFRSADNLEMIETTIGCIFGGQDYHENFHYTICHPGLMDHYLKQAGIKETIEFRLLEGINVQFRATK